MTRRTEVKKRLLVTIILFTMVISLVSPMGGVRAEGATAIAPPPEHTTDAEVSEQLDIIRFGNVTSEGEHDFEERLSVAGVDSVPEPEMVGDDGKLQGGGLGHGLTYRYIQPSPDSSKAFEGKLEFTLKADPTQQNYLSIRLSGTQQGRGNLMLYGPDGDTSILNPHFGREYSELDNGYQDGAPFLGRYYYNTYAIPADLVKADGTVRLSIMSTGKFSPYGNNTYGHQTQNSKYIYSAATHTNPYYVPEDDYTGEIPIGSPIEVETSQGAYSVLQAQGKDLLELILSWQMYGETFDKFKTSQNDFLEGAVVTYTPLSELAKFNGQTREDWAKKVTGQAINFQNWSPMMSTEILANAYMNEWSDEYYRSDELLVRIMKLYDFFARAQDSQGAWCVPTTGQNAYRWIGTSLDGSGNRGKGENWPLLSLGTDSMVQTLLLLHQYILNSGDDELKKKYVDLLDEKQDYNLDGEIDISRRTAYIQMFAMLRDYQYSPVKGDFYDPTTRAGTANQDFGFAYDANRAVEMMFESMAFSDQDHPSDIEQRYQVKDSTPYLHQLEYKLGEMVDGEKWFSDQGVGLEGGASHGGWAGEYGLLLLKVVNKYAESAVGSPDIEERFGELSYNAHETAAYFLRPSVTADGNDILISEMYGGSRNAANGQKIAYPIGGYTALERGSIAALRVMFKYIEDNRALAETFKQEIVQDRTPHVHTRIIELQELLKYYKETEALQQDMEKSGDIPLLPMEDGHPDFAWADPDAQSVVFKNKGDKVYVTFNYRRGNWQYNDMTRIHFTTDHIDRLANVIGSSKAGNHVFEDTKTHPNGKAYTHTRADGFSQVRYGKYAIGMNQSKDDSSVGQTGKVYVLDTKGIKKAKDLISGKEYEAKGKNDIVVQVQPRQTVVLEVLQEKPTYEVSVLYIEGQNVLKTERIPAALGEQVTVNAKAIEGYKLQSETSVIHRVSQEHSDNIVTFHYEANASPIFRSDGFPGEEAPFRISHLDGAQGEVTLDDEGMPVAISSMGSGHFSPTFAYQEVTGDVTIQTGLERFETTKTDKEYFSLIIADSLDLKAANYVQLRHFPNNNNILLVSHRAYQGETITGYWAGDMNNKKVPIQFRLSKEGNRIHYEFSLDGGQTYQKTSKPEIDFNMGGKLYAGAAMTTIHGENNTAYLTELLVDSDDKVLKPYEPGTTIHADLGADDAEEDEITYRVHGLPEGAKWDETTGHLEWTPDTPGSYMLKIDAIDPYHTVPVSQYKEVVVAATEEEYEELRTDLERVPHVRNIRISEGEQVSFSADALGATVQIDSDVSSEPYDGQGNWVWNTQTGDAGTYHAILTYKFDQNVVTRIVTITVEQKKAGIDYSDPNWKVSFSKWVPQKATLGREFVFDVETIVPIDGFGLNVNAINLPEGASFVNRTLRWTPDNGSKQSNVRITFQAVQPNGKKTNGVLSIQIVKGKVNK
ncbi:putative Ig domain-containing protein [Paenibacillus illinoisensis]|uniref:putative Ig domain-containing protein n=1 Tax=Paenibacillus illinoisensis TaxID=59845 RepID=UPI003D268FCE